MSRRVFAGSRTNRFTNLCPLLFSILFLLPDGCIPGRAMSSIQDQPSMQASEKATSRPCPSGTTCENFRRQVARVCERMKDESSLSPNPVPEIFMEHTLNSDPRRIASQAALKDSDIVFHTAACAAYTSDQQLTNTALLRSLEFLELWSAVYVPPGKSHQ